MSAITVYKNENLTTINYTREISKGKTADLVNLVEFFRQIPFFEAIRWICSCLGLDYYHSPAQDLPESLKVTKLLMELGDGIDTDEDDVPVRPIPEHILSYYKPWLSKLFLKDGISYHTQSVFGVAFDDETNRITIPIYDEIGNLVGVKGRYWSNQVPDGLSKYMYIEPCPRYKILYGLNQTYQSIRKEGIVYVFESEKAVMQCWSAGIQNCVATGGKRVSQNQIELLTRLCVPICFCFDQDVMRKELEDLSERFLNEVVIYATLDQENILDEKQSPSDDIKKFKTLVDKKIRLK